MVRHCANTQLSFRVLAKCTDLATRVDDQRVRATTCDLADLDLHRDTLRRRLIFEIPCAQLALIILATSKKSAHAIYERRVLTACRYVACLGTERQIDDFRVTIHVFRLRESAELSICVRTPREHLTSLGHCQCVISTAH